MIRLALTLAIYTSLISVAAASLTPRTRPGTFGVQASSSPKLLAELLDQTATRGARPEYVLTNETEILLDGKPCRYEAVPTNASIIHMEVGADKKTVLKILFRTQK